MISINKKTSLGVLLLLILIFGVIVGMSNQNTEKITDAVSILFVGNSHMRTGNVPGQLQALAGLHGIEITYVDVSRNGANLDDAMRNNAIREMQNRSFDYVVMQARGRSIRPTNDIDGFLNDIRIFSDQIRENGAIPVLYSPGWANINLRPDEELQMILTEAHKQAAYENDIILINAGDAWVHAYRNNIQGLSLYARDGIHANHSGAFLTASVFMATLFDLNVENIPAGNVIDNVPILNILTIAGIVAISLFIIYQFIKKRPLRLKAPLFVIVSIAMFQAMSFFPHVFIFMEGGSRLLLLYAIGFTLLWVTLCSVYRIVWIKFAEKQSLSIAKKYMLYILACGIIFGLTFIPALEMCLPLYRGDNAISLAHAAWELVNSF